MSGTKFCEECRWFNGPDGCVAPQNRGDGRGMARVHRTTKVVYGPRWLTASVQREIWWPFDFMMKACGWRARWFERARAEREHV